MTDIIGGVVGPVVGGAMSGAQQRRNDERLRRREAASSLAAWMVPVLEQLRHLRDRRDSAFWVDQIPAIYASIDAMKIRLPHQWCHLKRSVRGCLGEALGNGLIFLDTGDDVLGDTIEYSGRWADNAADYIEMCLNQVRAWDHLWSERSARRVRIPDFDVWLRATERCATY